jgi:hypothetical protein
LELGSLLGGLLPQTRIDIIRSCSSNLDSFVLSKIKELKKNVDKKCVLDWYIERSNFGNKYIGVGDMKELGSEEDVTIMMKDGRVEL